MTPKIFQKLIGARGGANMDASQDAIMNLSMNADANLPQQINNLVGKIKPWKYMGLDVAVAYCCALTRWWFTRKPKPVPEGAHPEWPGYTGVGTKLEFKLKFQAYTSQCLVENTIFSSFPTHDDRNLTPKQLAARAQIKELFIDVKNSRMPFNTELIAKFMRLFDQFFFFGAMANNTIPHLFPKMWETPVRDPLEDDPNTRKIPWGFTSDRYVRGYGPYCQINLAGPSFYILTPRIMTPRFFIETLIHEMVHAYINLYLCRCQLCYSDLPNTRGVTGHGPTFLMLLDCIDRTMRSWDIGMSGLVRERKFENGVYRRIDEVKLLHQKETTVYQEIMISPAAGEQQPNQTGEMPAPEPTRVVLEDLDKAYGTKEFNVARGLHIRNPGVNVYMRNARVGGSVVNMYKVKETCEIVEELIALKAARFNMKSWAKRTIHLPRLDTERTFHLPRLDMKNTLCWPRKKSEATTESGPRQLGSQSGAKAKSSLRRLGKKTEAKVKSVLRRAGKKSEETGEVKTKRSFPWMGKKTEEKSEAKTKTSCFRRLEKKIEKKIEKKTQETVANGFRWLKERADKKKKSRTNA